MTVFVIRVIEKKLIANLWKITYKKHAYLQVTIVSIIVVIMWCMRMEKRRL